MSMRNERISVGCRVDSNAVLLIDEAADGEGMSRAEWIERAILRSLGKRPRHSLKARVASLEQRVKELEGKK